MELKINKEKIQDLGYSCWVLGPTGYHFDREMFAKLIAKECVKIADTYVKEAWLNEEGKILSPTARSSIGKRIEKEFGL